MIQKLMKHPEMYEVNVNRNMKKSRERIWIGWTNRPVREGSWSRSSPSGTTSPTGRLMFRILSCWPLLPEDVCSWKGRKSRNRCLIAGYVIPLEISRKVQERKSTRTTFLLGNAGARSGRSS